MRAAVRVEAAKEVEETAAVRVAAVTVGAASVEARVEAEKVAAVKAVARAVARAVEMAAEMAVVREAYTAEAVGVMAAKERSLQSRIVYETFSEEIAATAKKAASEAHPVESV